MEGCGLGAGESETSLTHREIAQGLAECGGIHVRPQCFGEPQLGVGELPQQEVADAQVAPGADEEVGRREVGQRGVRAEGGFVDVPGLQASGRDFLGQAPRAWMRPKR